MDLGTRTGRDRSSSPAVGIVGRLLTGFVVAVVCTPAGVSGAFLVLPVQMQVFHVPSPAVSATNLLYNVVSAPAGALTYFRRSRLDVPLAIALCTGTAPGVVLGAVVRSTWLADPDRFGGIAAILLIGLGIRLLLDARRPSDPDEGGLTVPLPPRWRLNAVGPRRRVRRRHLRAGRRGADRPVAGERRATAGVAGRGRRPGDHDGHVGHRARHLRPRRGGGHRPRRCAPLDRRAGARAWAGWSARWSAPASSRGIPVPALKLVLAVAAVAAGSARSPDQPGDQAGRRPVMAMTRSSSGAPSGTVTSGPKQPGAGLLLARSGELRDEAVHRLQGGLVARVVLAARPGDVPPVDDELVEGDDPGHLAGQVDTAGPGHARPGVGRTPRLRQAGEIGLDASAPPLLEARTVTGRGRPAGVCAGLRRGLGERDRQPTDVVEEVAERVVRARRRVGERIVGHRRDERTEASSCWSEIDGHGDVDGSRRTNSSVRPVPPRALRTGALRGGPAHAAGG